MKKYSLIYLVVFCLFSHTCMAAEEKPQPPPAAVIETGNIVQIAASLLVVILAIFALAWFLRRMNFAQAPADLIKVLSSCNVGQRERIVILEVNDTCLVVGITPGQIRTLHTYPKPESYEQFESSKSKLDNRFAKLLSNVVKQQKQEKP